ncbi:MAG: acetylornithine deacetylase [Alphaproteobacteria bacterium]|nr:acetylornithine deacetylase [Alphaproteobacteria bacterium]
MSFNHKSIELLKKLISFNTISCNTNLELIRWAEFYLQQFGAETRLTTSPEGNKANLFATFKAHDGNRHQGGVVFSGHTDVVPVENQGWKTSPFELYIGNGNAYGRGVSDMKGFIAIVMSLADRISSAKLKVPFHFALSYDEEVGCVGVRQLIKDFTQAGFKPSGCIVGEPSMMQLVVGHRGQITYKCEIIGREAHSSLTQQGVNAIEYASRIITFMYQIGQEIINSGERYSFFDPGFNTFNTGIVSGGTVLNVVPNHCEFFFEYRFLPGHERLDQVERIIHYARDVLVPEMRKVYEHAEIKFTQVSKIPSFKAFEDSPFVEILKSVTGVNELNSVSYGAEAGIFVENGIDSIICGPGNIDQAHEPNESISLDQLMRCEEFIEKLITYYTL